MADRRAGAVGLTVLRAESLHPYDRSAPTGAMDTRALLAQRLGTGAWLCLAATALAVVSDTVSGAYAHPWLSGIELVQAGFLLGVWLAMRTPALMLRVPTIAVVAVLVVAATTGATSVLRGSASSAAMLLLLMAVGPAMLLPWGFRRQVVVVAGVAVILAACVYAIRGSVHEPLGPEVFPVVIGFGASLYAAYELERHRRAENRQTRTLQLQDAALAAAANGIVITTRDGVIRWVNPAYLHQIGYSREEVIGRTLRLLKSGTQNQAFYENLWRTILAGNVWRGELVNRRKNGSLLPEEMTITPVRGDGGEITHFVAIKQDISDRVRTEQALRRSEQYFRALIQSAPDLISLVDADGVIQYDSPAVERVLGYGVGERYGRDALADVHPDDVGPLREALAALLREPDSTVAVHYRRRHKDGAWRYLESVARNLLHEPAVGALVVNSHDVTERTLAAASLARAKDAAEAANRAKSEFLARMSHEMHTPLNAILGMTDLALASSLAPEPRECLHVARRSAEALLEVIDELLDFAKLEAHELVLARAPLRVREDLEPTAQQLAARAHQRGLAFDWRVADEVPAQMLGDVRRLRQVLLNIAGNAIKFTEYGGVSVSAALIDAAPGNGDAALHVRVHDTGPGISADKIETLFAPFEVADGSNTRRYGGIGLGLSIARELVQMMGGRLWAESTPGQGSTFHFTVRCAVPPATKGPVRPAGDGGGHDGPGRPLRVLVAEDNPVNQRVLARLAERRGHVPTVASNGREALECLARERFDAVLMDVQMPVMDGIEATTAIRAGEAPGGARIPVIAVTAHAMKADEERCLAAGMDAYVAKPFDANRLFTLVERLVAAAPCRDDTASLAGHPPATNVAIARS